MDKPEYWVENLWLPLAVTVAGGLVLAGSAALFSSTVRRRFWLPIGRGLRWLTTLRLTTTGKIAVERETANQMIREQVSQYVELRADCERKLETAQVRIASLKDQVEAARAVGFNAGRASAAAETQPALSDERARGRTEAEADARVAIERARSEAHAAGKAEGLAARGADAMQAAAARVDVVVDPVWRVSQTGPQQYWLDNVQDGVGVVADVRIEAVLGEFSFSSGNQWPGPWSRGAGFSGELVGAGAKLGARMKVSWTSPNGRRHTADARVEPPPREPRRAIVL